EANQLARYLVKKGVKQGDNVAILMDRSIEFVISVFAIIKSGAAFLPINPMKKRSIAIHKPT
ncbi:AMP-binding protein, partial [bacterium]|nr:AMP-binding protein [bacterium]